MTRNYNRLIVFSLCIGFIALSFFTFFSCKANANDAFGTVDCATELQLYWKNDEDKTYADTVFQEINSMSYLGLSPSFTITDFSVTILDQKEMPDIIPGSEDAQEVLYPVVTTKWMYYYSLLWQEGAIPIEKALIDAILADEYCMEKVCLDWYSYLIDVENSPYYGMPWREALLKAGGTIPLSKTPFYALGTDLTAIHLDAGTWTICMLSRASLLPAALQRYGAIDVNLLSGKGKIIVKIPCERILSTGERISDYKKITLDVVGYIETEADKLLSTGVSMDKNSEEYKIVMQQLQNPVFYSVCGNFLEEVNS